MGVSCHFLGEFHGFFMVANGADSFCKTGSSGGRFLRGDPLTKLVTGGCDGIICIRITALTGVGGIAILRASGHSDFCTVSMLRSFDGNLITFSTTAGIKFGAFRTTSGLFYGFHKTV